MCIFLIPKNDFCCKGRTRTSTRRLAEEQSARAGGQPQLLFVYPVFPTLETRGHGCQFHHLTIWVLVIGYWGLVIRGFV